MQTVSVVLALALLVAPAAARQQDRVSAQAGAFAPEQLEQLVAPIALYPDGLLAQVLMAATYPLEIVQAARWVQKNPGLAGDLLEAALAEQTWDPSVKSLCGFADVLQRMNDNLDWTQDLGDAFLSQQAALMDTVQTMRRKAFDEGYLKSGKELTVTEQPDKIIVIEVGQPEVTYVPTYYPTAVYGSWGYPSWYYPYLYPPPPPGAVYFAFTAGVYWGAACWGGCHWGWGHTEIDIDVDHYNRFVDRTEPVARRQQVKDKVGTGTRGNWQHDPQHRQNVGYRDAPAAQRFGAGTGPARVPREQARGYADRAGSGAQNPYEAQMRMQAEAARGSALSSLPPPRMHDPRPHDPRPIEAPTPWPAVGQPGGAWGAGSFSGSHNPGFDHAGSARGSASRGSPGARGGGGRR